MNIPDLNRLRVFYLVFECQSVGAAAKELHITQSAVSQHLKKLELELDTLLFTRVHRRLVPTSQGEALHAMMAPFLESLEEGIQHLQRAHDTPYGLLKVGAPVDFGQRYVPGLFASFREMYPDVRFHLELGHPTELLAQLKGGKLDLSLIDLLPRPQDRELSIFHIAPVFWEERILVCSAEYYRRNQPESLDLETLKGLSYIASHPNATSLRSWFRHHYSDDASDCSIALSVESVQAAIAGVESHMGLAVVPSHLVSAQLESQEFMAIPTEQSPTSSPVSLVHLLDKALTLTERTFLQHLQDNLECSA